MGASTAGSAAAAAGLGSVATRSLIQRRKPPGSTGAAGFTPLADGLSVFGAATGVTSLQSATGRVAVAAGGEAAAPARSGRSEP